MTAARAKAPTLAWLLTALACLLAGMAIVESRHQAVTLPVWAPVGLVETGDVAATQTRAPESNPTPMLASGEQLAPSRALLSEDALVWLAAGTADLRLERLTVPPGTSLPPEVAAGPTVLLVEAGTVSVVVDDIAFIGQGLDPTQFVATLSPRERLIIAPGARYAVRNDGPLPAVALALTLAPPDARAPMSGGKGLP
jgi:hypothetical protein